MSYPKSGNGALSDRIGRTSRPGRGRDTESRGCPREDASGEDSRHGRDPYLSQRGPAQVASDRDGSLADPSALEVDASELSRNEAVLQSTSCLTL